MRLTLVLAALLAAFWLLLSGHVTPLLLALGAGSVAFVVAIAWRMRVVDRESVPVHLAPRWPRYLLWLVPEILRSALAVAWRVWSPRPGLRPVVGVTPVHDLSELAQVTYANSVTLTPGTLSLSVDDEGIEVHSLDESYVAELDAGGIRDRVRRLEAG